MPAVLALMGGRLFAWSFGAPRLLSAPWGRLAGTGGLVLRRAVIFGGASTVVLVALALPALGIETGPPDPKFLPADNQARQDVEAIQRAMGPGFPYAFNIVVASDSGPVTERKTADLGTLKTQLNDSKKLLKGAPKDLGKLEGGLGEAGAGAVQLQDGLREAAAGASQVAGGGGDALGGANDLKTGAGQALAGAKQISRGLGQAAALKDSLPQVKDMAANVAAGNTAVNEANSSAQKLSSELQAALGALQSMAPAGKQDPAYAQVQPALADTQQSAGSVSSTLGGVKVKVGAATLVSAAAAGQLADLSDGLTQLYGGSNDLTAGLTRLRNGNAATWSARWRPPCSSSRPVSTSSATARSASTRSP